MNTLHVKAPPPTYAKGARTSCVIDSDVDITLNRMLLPAVDTGGDPYTRLPIGISFQTGSGLMPFAAATGVILLDMPESILVRFKGELQPSITLRDLVHAIPQTG